MSAATKCYACDAAPVGVRDRRPEGGRVENACERHAQRHVGGELVARGYLTRLDVAVRDAAEGDPNAQPPGTKVLTKPAAAEMIDAALRAAMEGASR